MRACGGDNFYCDGDKSTAPTKVLPGFYTTDYSSLYPAVSFEELITSSIDHADSKGRLSSHKYTASELVRQAYSDTFPPNTQVRSPCPPGYYRDWADDAWWSAFDGNRSAITTYRNIPSCKLCPENTYKAVNGDDPALCQPCNPGVSEVTYLSLYKCTCNCFQ